MNATSKKNVRFYPWSEAQYCLDFIKPLKQCRTYPSKKNAQQKLKCREPFTWHSFSSSTHSVVMTATFIDRVAGDSANQYSLYISGPEQNTTSAKRLFRSGSLRCRGYYRLISLKSDSIFGDKRQGVAARMAKIIGRYLLVLMLLLPTTILFVGQRKSTSLRASCLLLRGSSLTWDAVVESVLLTNKNGVTNCHNASFSCCNYLPMQKMMLMS